MRSTSISAYADLVASGALNAKQRAVWGALHVDGPKTGRELDQMLSTQDAHKRLSELERAGLVYEIRKTTCKVTSRKAILWALTSKDPSTVTRSELQGPYVPKRPSKDTLRKVASKLSRGDRDDALVAAWLAYISK